MVRKSYILILFFCFIVKLSYGQTSLNPGDIAMVTLNSDEKDNFDFIIFEDISTGTEIFFTDNAFDGSSLYDNEGVISFKANKDYTKGTVLSYTGNDDEQFVKNGNFNLSGSGDNLLVYQGTVNEALFLYGVSIAKSNVFTTCWINEGLPNTNVSYLPPVLSLEDYTAVNLGNYDNYQYKNESSHTGTHQSLLKEFSLPENYEKHNTEIFQTYTKSYEVLDALPAKIQINSLDLSATEVGIDSDDNLIYVMQLSAFNEMVVLESVSVQFSGSFELSDIDQITAYYSDDAFLGESVDLVKKWNSGFNQNLVLGKGLDVPAGKSRYIIFTCNVSKNASLNHDIKMLAPVQDDFIFTGNPEIEMNSKTGAVFTIQDLPEILISDNFDSFISGYWENINDWEADFSNSISGVQSLRHSREASGTSVLPHEILPEQIQGNDIYWQFQLKNGDWKPSSSNNFRFYLFSDRLNFNEDGTKGYSIGINQAENNNLLSLCRWDSDNSVDVLATRFEWKENMQVGIKVVYKAQGLWQIWVDKNGGFSNVELLGEYEEKVMPTATACGLLFEYTSSRAGELWFDDYTLAVKNAAPSIFEVTSLNETKLKVQFSEVVDGLQAENSDNYKLNGTHVIDAVIDLNDYSVVYLTVNNLLSGENKLQVSAIMDVKGLKMEDALVDFEFMLPTKTGDVVINEIMADVNPAPVQLPEQDYIELHNTNDFAIDLTDWQLLINDKTMDFPQGQIPANGYLLICPKGKESEFENYSPVVGLFSTSDLTTTGKTIKLVKNDLVVDEISYNSDLYNDDEKKNGGWSIERIDPLRSCAPLYNWKASANANGGTPCAVNSVYKNNQDEKAPNLVDVVIYDANTVEISFSEQIDIIIAKNIVNYSVDNGIGSPVVVTIQEQQTNIKLGFASPFLENNKYKLTINSISDLCGNQLQDTNREFEFHELKFNDISINEIMIDPSPSVQLPEHEYIELRNNTEYAISLSNWVLQVGDKDMFIPEYVLEAGKFLLLCRAEARFFMSGYGAALAVDGFSSLSNSSDDILLYNPNKQLISAITYTSMWHENSNKADGGWSLERIDPINPSTNADNWASSTDTHGGTPGAENSVFSTNPDVIAPRFISAALSDEKSLVLSFSEPINLSDFKAQNIAVDNYSGEVVSIMPIDILGKNILLEFSNSFEDGKKYEIEVVDVIDWSDNKIGDDNRKEFSIPQEVGFRDIVINEVLFNPRSGGYDFVEIYNKSEKVIDLSNLLIASVDADGVIKDYANVSEQPRYIMPGAYYVLTENPENIKEYYYCENPDNFLSIKNMPSLPDDEGRPAIVTKSNVTIDDFYYTDEMHFSLMTNKEGVSLERLNYDSETNSTSNWASASSGVGYATPTYKNSQYREYEEQKDEDIYLENKSFSPDNDGYEDKLLIHYLFDKPENVANVKIYDSRGRQVKYLVNNELLGTSGTWSWDGITDDNEKARIGIYILFVEVFNEEGNVTEKKIPCVVASKL